MKQSRALFLLGTLLTGALLVASCSKASQSPIQVNAGNGNVTYFVDISDVSSWWGNDSPTTYFDALNGSTHQVYSMSAAYKYNSTLLKVSIPTSTTFDKVIIVRGSSSFDGTNWDSERWNQSVDISMSNDGSDHAIKIYDSKDGNGSLYASTGGDLILANNYGSYFLSFDLCKDSGGMATGAASNWGKLRNEYTDYLSGYLTDANYLKNYSTYVDDSNFIDLALRRYDNIIYKHSNDYGNFLSRTPYIPNQVSFESISSMMSSQSAIYACALLGLIGAIGGCAYFMKRHH